ncbi:hypothetical protein PV682_05690 [Streptomyces niveiscabiei]|uniref:hypothetical protein n=1 Tax=Streptomyces niveiscabiei TaxID=164115 RepID=UPI0029AAB984|nr:hypothetical protein [Streptomyces niveiscabiei]MDX3380941.1 hypothetical protein [Streptomyces niveiscabiei]
MSASPGVRGLRAAVFAAVCVLLAVGAHLVAVGETPPAGVQGLGFCVVFGAGWVLGGRERSLVGIGGATLVAQGALHAGFGAVARGAGGMTGMRMTGLIQPPGHARTPVHLRMPVPLSIAAHPRMPAHMNMPVPPHLAHHATPHTLAAHFLAALLTSWWLRRGEAALWSLLRRAVALVPGLVAWWRGPVRIAGARRVVRPWRCLPAPRSLLLRHVVRRRGPPGPVPYPA